MSLTDALAQSPNTPFALMADSVGVGTIVDMATAMGLDTYTTDGTADAMRRSGAFILGVTPVATSELADVQATIAAGGRWCRNHFVDSITRGREHLYTPPTSCRNALAPPREVATLAAALSKDTTSGTAAVAANTEGWGWTMAGKTGTTSDSRSAVFAGFTGRLAGATMVFDPNGSQGVCTSPLWLCGATGDVYGGMEPARAWMQAAAPVAENYDAGVLPDGAQAGPAGATVTATPPTPARAATGETATALTSAVTGKPESQAREVLRTRGYGLRAIIRQPSSGEAPGTVVGVDFPQGDAPGVMVDLRVAR